MKIRTVFVLCALLGSLSVRAAEPPASPSATPIKHPSQKSCNKQADGKKLSGPARTQFVKNCQAGKSA